MFLDFNNGYVGGKKLTHLAYYLMNELDREEDALMPTTNLVENVHIHPYMCGFLLEMVAR
jgi:hypothetical protein